MTIEKDDTFFSRLVSKENSVANPSFRVYYGNVSSAVPFTWEIQPGTPKHNFHDTSIPPLTPPPSYYTSNPGNNNKKPTKSKYYLKSKLLYNLLSNNNHVRKGYVPTSSPSSLSASSWSSSMASTSKGFTSRRRHFSSFGSSFDDGHMYGFESPDSFMCFGMNNNKIRNQKRGGTAYKLVMMKKAFFAILSRRSG
ncbi:hypothetical protein Tco_0108264 [Tanacetum coccineum]